MKKVVWILWIALSLSIGSYYAWALLSEDAQSKEAFLIGETSYGHYQIELSCDSCHSEAFAGEDGLQKACESCHEQELEEAHDSHPRKKFTDPRNADRVEILDARYCVSCHQEHKQEQTLEMGLTLPEDFCYQCHQDIAEERDTHKDASFDSCASAGCHNYHDNRALYESFLVKHADQPDLLGNPHLPVVNHASLKAKRPKTLELTSDEQAYLLGNPAQMQDWQHSQHAQAGVSCASCHQPEPTQEWIVKPDHQSCASCHEYETTTFTQGKHGMRINSELGEAIKVVEAKLSFHEQAMGKQQSCHACHDPHQQDTQFAAVEACLGCHNDDHSQNFKASPHGQLWQQVEDGILAKEQGVSCASCHMPAIEQKRGDQVVVKVDHNQNANLRPNEKMIRPVCQNCHGLGFAIDALADEQLIQQNFNGLPSSHVPSVQWAVDEAKP